MRNQKIEFNMENPEADSPKGRPNNAAVFLLNQDYCEVKIEEKQFRMEFDEEEMMKMIKEMGSGTEESSGRNTDMV